MEDFQEERRRRCGWFAAESRAEMVGLCQRGDRSVGQVVGGVDLIETAVRGWVRQGEGDAGSRGDGLACSERAGLAVLGGGNRRLREEVEIFKRARALFAKQTR